MAQGNSRSAASGRKSEAVSRKRHNLRHKAANCNAATVYPFLGFPRTPFLTVAENLPLYRQSQSEPPVKRVVLIFSKWFKMVQTRRQDGLPPFRDGGFRAWCTPVRGRSPPSPWCRPSGDGWRRRRLQSPAYPASAPPWRCGSRRWIPP